MQHRGLWIVYIAIEKVFLKVLKIVFKPVCTGRNYILKVIVSLEEENDTPIRYRKHVAG